MNHNIIATLMPYVWSYVAIEVGIFAIAIIRILPAVGARNDRP